MIGSLLSRFVCILIGHIYPLYRTFKVVRCLPEKISRRESIIGTSVFDLKRVVAYWTVHGVFTFAEFFIDFFVFIIPMYYEVKIIFLLWLVYNDFSGALFFFDTFVDEILSKHEGAIELSLENSKKVLKQKLAAGVGALADVAAQAGVAAIRKVVASLRCSQKQTFRKFPLLKSRIHFRSPKTRFSTVWSDRTPARRKAAGLCNRGTVASCARTHSV